MVLALMQLSALAQRAYVGVRGGASYGKLNGINSSNHSYVSGWHGGLTLQYQLETRFSLQTEFSYVEKGYQAKEFRPDQRSVLVGKPYNMRDQVQAKYWEVPVLGVLRVAKNGFVMLGPRLSILKDVQRKVEVQSFTTPQAPITTVTEEHNENKYFENTTVGFIVGAGYRLPMGLGLDVRYNQDFSNGLTERKFEKFSNLQVGLSYVVGIGHAQYVKQPDSLRQAKPYRIVRRQKATQVVFRRQSDLPQVYFVWTPTAANNSTPLEIRLSGSSGTVEQTPGFVGFRNVQFPFKGTITYFIGDEPTELEVEITQPGMWQVSVTR